MRFLVALFGVVFFATPSFAEGITFSYLQNEHAYHSSARPTRHAQRRDYASAVSYRTTKRSRSVARYASLGRQQNREYATNFQGGSGFGPRPRAWCGYYMRQKLGVRNPSYNLARNWLNYGRPSGPQIGAVVVWPHHVGQIVGREGGRWIVNQGNYRNRVATVAMNLTGVIGYRMP